MRLFEKVATSKQGMTLIELIITLTILGIITASIANFFSDSQLELIASERKISAQTELNNAMRDITENLKKVEQEKVDSTFETIEFKESGDTDYIILRNNNDEIIYGVINKVLYRAVNTSVNPSINRKNKDTLDTYLTTALGKTAVLSNVETFSVNKEVNPNGYNYIVEITINPDDVGRKTIGSITLTNKFTPRFDMSIR